MTVEGKHEEKHEEHGQIYRHFVRKYVLPEDCDIKSLESKLSSHGVLSITAPRISPGKQTKNHCGTATSIDTESNKEKAKLKCNI